MKTLKAVTALVMLALLSATNIANATPVQATPAIIGVTALDDSVNWQPDGLYAYQETVVAFFVPQLEQEMAADFSAGPLAHVMVPKMAYSPRFRLRRDGTLEEIVETDIFGNEIDKSYRSNYFAM